MRAGVSWPTKGDARTFRRRVTGAFATSAVVIAAGLGAAAAHDLALLRSLVPLAVSAALLVGLWTHGAARRAARRTEVERSFAGLVVRHHGRSYTVDTDPLAGEYPTRRHAAEAAMQRGSWALVVHAWDRYYLLSCAPHNEASTAPAAAAVPVSFRSRAVSDVVPGITDGMALGA